MNPVNPAGSSASRPTGLPDPLGNSRETGAFIVSAGARTRVPRDPADAAMSVKRRWERTDMNEDRQARSAVATERQTEVAVLAGGCFWGVEEILREVPGVIDTDVG